MNASFHQNQRSQAKENSLDLFSVMIKEDLVADTQNISLKIGVVSKKKVVFLHFQNSGP